MNTPLKKLNFYLIQLFSFATINVEIGNPYSIAGQFFDSIN